MTQPRCAFLPGRSARAHCRRHRHVKFYHGFLVIRRFPKKCHTTQGYQVGRITGRPFPLVATRKSATIVVRTIRTNGIDLTHDCCQNRRANSTAQPWHDISRRSTISAWHHRLARSTGQRRLTNWQPPRGGGNCLPEAVVNIRAWLTEPRYAQYAPQVVEHMAAGRWKQLDDVFWTIIPFGTGGRRGKMYPIGSNAINDRTIGKCSRAGRLRKARCHWLRWLCHRLRHPAPIARISPSCVPK